MHLSDCPGKKQFDAIAPPAYARFRKFMQAQNQNAFINLDFHCGKHSALERTRGDVLNLQMTNFGKLFIIA